MHIPQPRPLVLMSAAVLVVLLYFLAPFVRLVVFTMPIYHRVRWIRPLGDDLYKYRFCKYTLPPDYQFLSYHNGGGDFGVFKGETGGRQLLTFQQPQTRQLLLILQLREFPQVDLAKVSIEKKPIEQNVAKTTNETKNGYDLAYLELSWIPWLGKPNSPPSALRIRGFSTIQQETFETEKTRGLIFRGSFTQLGLYRDPKWFFFQYLVPLFNFKSPREGALAIVNDNATGQTLFVLSVNASGAPFTEGDVLIVAKSLTFEGQPVEHPLKEWFEPGSKVKHKVNRKIELQWEKK